MGDFDPASVGTGVSGVAEKSYYDVKLTPMVSGFTDSVECTMENTPMVTYVCVPNLGPCLSFTSDVITVSSGCSHP